MPIPHTEQVRCLDPEKGSHSPRGSTWAAGPGSRYWGVGWEVVTAPLEQSGGRLAG